MKLGADRAVGAPVLDKGHERADVALGTASLHSASTSVTVSTT